MLRSRDQFLVSVAWSTGLGSHTLWSRSFKDALLEELVFLKCNDIWLWIFHKWRNGNNHQSFNICYFTCVTKNKTYQFVLLSVTCNWLSWTGLGLVVIGLGLMTFVSSRSQRTVWSRSWSHKLLVSLTSLPVPVPTSIYGRFPCDHGFACSFIHLYQQRTIWDTWNRFSMQSPNKQYQNTKDNKAPTQTRCLAPSNVHPAPDSWQMKHWSLYTGSTIQ